MRPVVRWRMLVLELIATAVAGLFYFGLCYLLDIDPGVFALGVLAAQAGARAVAKTVANTP